MVVKVAKSGYDANSATDDQLVFNSAQNVFKIVKTLPMTLDLVVSPGNYYGSTTLAHGLSTTPAIMPFIVLPSAISWSNPHINHTNPAMAYGTVASVFKMFCLAEVTVDETNCYLSAQVDNSFSNGTYTFTATVYLLQETFS